MQANQSLARAFGILEYLADNPGARLKDVAAACELAAPTASRFLSNLSELGYIQPQSQGFAIATRLAALSRGTYALDTHASIQEILRVLADACHLTAFFVKNDNDEAVYIQRALPQHASLMNTQRIGYRAPLYCTGVGKIFLAARSDEAIRSYCRKTKMESLTHKTMCDAASLLRVIQKVRKQAYALDDEECEIGVKCLAVPVTNQAGIVQASISISGAASLFTRENIKQFIVALRHAAQQLLELQQQHRLEDL